MEALEGRGVAVRAPDPVDLPAELARVIRAAKDLTSELGHRPSSDEIAARAGLDRAAVRRALLYARVLSR
jgi:DNA-directed RNA polymerase specialized sigma subunit